MRKLLVMLPLLCGSIACAQRAPDTKTPTKEDLLITAAQLETILNNVPVSKETGKPGEVSSKLLDDGKSNVAFIRLNEADKPHVHDKFSEIYIIKEGSGTLETGGTMLGPFTSGGVHHQQAQAPRAPAPEVGGDKAGTAIEGGRFQEVKAGDVVFIPADIPHTWTKVEKPLIYFAIKVPRAD